MTFRQPTSLALTADGQRLYMTDQSMGQVIWFDFKLGQAGRIASDVGFAQPFGVALEPSRQRLRQRAPGAPGAGLQPGRPAPPRVRRRGGAADRSGHRRRSGSWSTWLDGSFPTSQNHRVLVYSLQGKLLRTIGTRGTAPGQFNFPAHLTVDRDGNLFVVDTLNFRVQVFDPEGNVFRFFGEAGESLGKFARPKGVAVDRRGIVYVVDAEMANVQMFNDRSQLLMSFGGKINMLEYFDYPGPDRRRPGRQVHLRRRPEQRAASRQRLRVPRGGGAAPAAPAKAPGAGAMAPAANPAASAAR